MKGNILKLKYKYLCFVTFHKLYAPEIKDLQNAEGIAIMNHQL